MSQRHISHPLFVSFDVLPSDAHEGPQTFFHFEDLKDIITAV